MCIRLSGNSIVHYNAVRSSETEKREAVLLPTKVLSEPQGLLLFQVVRGGIEFRLGLRHVAVVQRCG
jgi:hypothetical protein